MILRLSFVSSNNDIQDVGAGHIADGIADQGDQLPAGTGLSILVLWNNHLTRNSSTHFARALVSILVAIHSFKPTRKIIRTCHGLEFNLSPFLERAL